MKNRKRVIVAFVMVAALCLGIGYAALNDTLYATGNLAVNKGEAQEDFKEDVYFTGDYTVADKAGQPISNGVTVTIAADSQGDTADQLKITVNAGVLQVKGDQVVIKATMQNDSLEYKALVTPQTATTSNSIFSVTTQHASHEIPKATQSGEDVVGGETDVTIIIELLSSPTEDLTNVTFTLPFNVSSIAN